MLLTCLYLEWVNSVEAVWGKSVFGGQCSNKKCFWILFCLDRKLAEHLWHLILMLYFQGALPSKVRQETVLARGQGPRLVSWNALPGGRTNWRLWSWVWETSPVSGEFFPFRDFIVYLNLKTISGWGGKYQGHDSIPQSSPQLPSLEQNVQHVLWLSSMNVGPQL